MEITGRWIVQAGKVVADENCKRIEKLTSAYLVTLAKDVSGWNVLFQDPSDKSFWELGYPESQMHDGGPHNCVAFR